MRTTEYTFKVTGRGPFPIDMLRYDACWPMTAEDANTIFASFDRSVRRSTYSVTLTTATKRYGPTEERWASFLFKVSYE